MSTIKESDICPFAKKCNFFKKGTCNKSHPCKFFPKCTSPHCLFEHVYIQLRETTVDEIEMTTPVKNSNFHLETPDAPLKPLEFLRFGLRADAPVFVPKFDTYACGQFDKKFNDFDQELDNEYDSSSSDENSHILYDGNHYLYREGKFLSYDEAHNAKLADGEEYREISEMIMATITEMNTDC